MRMMVLNKMSGNNRIILELKAIVFISLGISILSLTLTLILTPFIGGLLNILGLVCGAISLGAFIELMRVYDEQD